MFPKRFNYHSVFCMRDVLLDVGSRQYFIALTKALILVDTARRDVVVLYFDRDSPVINAPNTPSSMHPDAAVMTLRYETSGSVSSFPMRLAFETYVSVNSTPPLDAKPVLQP